METHAPSDEAATAEIGARLAVRLAPGDGVLLSGPLGAGKTCFARGVLRGLGWRGEVRSPTYPLLVPYPTSPPILHVDLYRVASPEGLGLEEYAADHVLLIEWPERLLHPISEREWHIALSPASLGRRITIEPPVG